MFRPGQSGNPGGRPKSATAIRSRALEMTPELLERWFNIATGHCADDIPYNVQFAAFREICNRALGLPVAVNADLDQMKEYDRMSSKELKRTILEQFGPDLLQLQAQALVPENSDDPKLTHVVAEDAEHAPKRDQSD
jgi:hypothetical protein